MRNRICRKSTLDNAKFNNKNQVVHVN